MLRKLLVTSSIGAIASAATAFTAFAQIDEIVITAQKREQSLQDVPIAVTAFDSARLEATGFNDITDLVNYTPGLDITTSQSSEQTTITLRGIGTGANNAGLEPAVGVFVDGVYRAQAGSSVFDLTDVERIEVLRGPQGTLFGRNTSGGAISIVSKRPEYDFGGNAEVTFGNLGLFQTKGAVTGPIVQDKLAFRLNANYQRRDGYIDNQLNGTELNDKDRWGVRGQFLFEPTATFSAVFAADYTRVDEVCCGAVVLDNDADDPVLVGNAETAIATLGGSPLSEDLYESDSRVTRANVDPTSEAEDFGFSLEANWDVAGHTITSITGYRDYQFNSRVDADFTELDAIENTRLWDQNAFSQELRLANESGGFWEYVVGGYFFSQNLDFNDSITFGEEGTELLDLNGEFAALGSLVGSPIPILPGYVTQGTPLALGLGGLPLLSVPGVLVNTTGGSNDPFPAGGSGLDFTTQDQRAFSFFTHNAFNFTEKFTFTAGLRYTNEKKEIDSSFVEVPAEGVPLAVTLNPVPPNPDALINSFAVFEAVSPLIPDLNTEFTDSVVTGTAKFQYDWTPKFTSYISYARGYKSGGTNADRTSGSPTFAPETVNSFETGLKGDFFTDRLRLNAAAYYADYNDFQNVTFVGTGFILENVGSVVSYGVELEGVAAPTDWLSIENQTTWQNVQYDDFEAGPCVQGPFAGVFGPPNANGLCRLAGGEVTNTPHIITTTAATITKPLFIDALSWYLRGEVSYRSEQSTDTNNDPRKIQEGYTTIGARAGIKSDDGMWEVIVWGKNLTDELYFHRSFDATVQEGRLLAYPSEPRTFGATIRTNF